jgi:hypothetical protein
VNMRTRSVLFVLALAFIAGISVWPARTGRVEVHRAAAFDTSPPLRQLRSVAAAEGTACDPSADCGLSPDDPDNQTPPPPVVARGQTVDAAGAAAEQTAQGTREPAKIVASFDGLGAGFSGPQGTAVTRNPSDNSLAVGPEHIVQIVNSRLAVFDKKGKALYGPVVTNTIFAGFGGQCEKQISGDAVVRYDQLADRWLFVLPVFRRPPGEPQGPYSMCYAISQGRDPLGPYHRYDFKRPLFPDYPRPAIWPDGYYIPTSTGDDVIQKHACVADRTKMLQGLPATEQCLIVDGANFFNNADIDGHGLPPPGAPNIMIAAGGTQLHKEFADNVLNVYEFHVDWETPSKTALKGPVKLPVAPYHYLCNGQLTNCVPQPGTDRRLDAQGDKIMQRLVYRNIGGRESIVGLHSVDTKAGGGGVRWYELRLDSLRKPFVYQQSTYAPDEFYRWMGSIAIDHQGNIGIGYSFGGTPHFAGQRFAARMANDPLSVMTLRETVLAEGAAAQTNTLRWEDYTTTAIDPSDDCTFWYVGDYLKAGTGTYSTRIGGFRVADCLRGTVGGTAFFDRDHDGKRSAGEAGLAGAAIAYSGAQSGRLVADAAGRFSTWLPADPAYAEPVYEFRGEAPAGTGWGVTGQSFRVSLKHGDTVTDANIGAVCTLKNKGGHDVGFWRSRRGGALLKTRGMEWKEGAGTPEAELRATSLNVSFGLQDENATIHDPNAGDWPTVGSLVQRAGKAAGNYREVLESLNHNSAVVTPSAPSACPAR